ncbi:unnamed protein product [Linum trigynum]|uniref:Uncharacterized protein n=1 Tax=Linum trigynum TaxID=586398 RepID=A0AAV2CPT0_9ROSI
MPGVLTPITKLTMRGGASIPTSSGVGLILDHQSPTDRQASSSNSLFTRPDRGQFLLSHRCDHFSSQVQPPSPCTE